LTYQQQWQEFGHELCHVLWHAGRQENISDSFCSYQEGQADNFAYHLCIPTFMLCRLKGVSTYEVMNLFNVEYGFASKRLEMYRNKIIMKGVTTKCQKDMYGIVAETGGNRSEERRVGKEWRWGWGTERQKQRRAAGRGRGVKR